MKGFVLNCFIVYHDTLAQIRGFAPVYRTGLLPAAALPCTALLTRRVNTQVSKFTSTGQTNHMDITAKHTKGTKKDKAGLIEGGFYRNF